MCISSRDRCSEPASHSPTRCCQPPARSLPLRGRLFRNDLHLRDDGIRVLHFTDVTAQSAIDARQYGLGAATGDIDNDGCVDLLLTNFGTNQLFHNNRNGTFTDISNQSGIEDKPGVAVAAAFLDYDRDHLEPPISRGESVGPETSPLLALCPCRLPGAKACTSNSSTRTPDPSSPHSTHQSVPMPPERRIPADRERATSRSPSDRLAASRRRTSLR